MEGMIRQSNLAKISNAEKLGFHITCRDVSYFLPAQNGACLAFQKPVIKTTYRFGTRCDGSSA
jgi:hypothetical protein